MEYGNPKQDSELVLPQTETEEISVVVVVEEKVPLYQSELYQDEKKSTALTVVKEIENEIRSNRPETV